MGFQTSGIWDTSYCSIVCGERILYLGTSTTVIKEIEYSRQGLRLSPHFKISLLSWSPHIVAVGFKLTFHPSLLKKCTYCISWWFLILFCAKLKGGGVLYCSLNSNSNLCSNEEWMHWWKGVDFFQVFWEWILSLVWLEFHDTFTIFVCLWWGMKTSLRLGGE